MHEGESYKPPHIFFFFHSLIFLRTHKAPQYRLFSSHDCIPWYFILFKLLFKQSSPRDSQFVTVRGERKLACRDGADLVCRRVLLARERGVSTLFN